MGLDSEDWASGSSSLSSALRTARTARAVKQAVVLEVRNGDPAPRLTVPSRASTTPPRQRVAKLVSKHGSTPSTPVCRVVTSASAAIPAGHASSILDSHSLVQPLPPYSSSNLESIPLMPQPQSSYLLGTSDSLGSASMQSQRTTYGEEGQSQTGRFSEVHSSRVSEAAHSDLGSGLAAALKVPYSAESSLLHRIGERAGLDKQSFKDEVTSLLVMEMAAFKATVCEATERDMQVLRSELQALQASNTYQASVLQRVEARMQVPRPQPALESAVVDCQASVEANGRDLQQLRLEVETMQATSMDAHGAQAAIDSAARELQQLKGQVDAMQSSFTLHQSTVRERLELLSSPRTIPVGGDKPSLDMAKEIKDCQLVMGVATRDLSQLKSQLESLTLASMDLDRRLGAREAQLPAPALPELKEGAAPLQRELQDMGYDSEASQSAIVELVKASQGLPALEREVETLKGQVQVIKAAGVDVCSKSLPELEKTVQQLKSQMDVYNVDACKAKDFSAIQMHIDQLQGDLGAFAGEQRDTLLAQVAQLRSEMTGTHSRVVQVEAGLQKLRADAVVERSSSSQVQLDQLRSDLSLLTEQYTPLMGQMAQLRADMSSLPTRTAQMEAQLVKTCADMASLPRQVEASLWAVEVKAQLAKLGTELASVPRGAQGAEGPVGSSVQTELNSLRSEVASLATEQRENVLAQLAQLRGEVAGIFPRTTQVEAQLAQLRVQVSNMPRSSQWEAQVANLRQEMQSLTLGPIELALADRTPSKRPSRDGSQSLSTQSLSLGSASSKRPSQEALSLPGRNSNHSGNDLPSLAHRPSQELIRREIAALLSGRDSEDEGRLSQLPGAVPA